MANTDLITLGGLSVFKTAMDSEVDAKIAAAGEGVTYTLSKNAEGKIVLTGSDSSTSSVTDTNTTYGFSQSGTTLTITPSDGDPITITLGEEITSDKVVAALGFTPMNSNVTHLSGDVATTTKVNGKALSGDITLSASDVGALADTTVIPDELADLSDDATHRLVTDTEKSYWNAKPEISDIPDVPDWALAASKPSYTASEVGALASTTTHLSGDIATTEKGANNGVATLGSDGKIPSSQLPSYVDDVVEYDNKASFPSTGETGKIYVDKATNKTYRWSGSEYVVIGSDLALGETSSTAYAGDKGKAATDAIANHKADTTSHITAAERTAWNAKSNLALGETSTTAYSGDKGKAVTDGLATHIADTSAHKDTTYTFASTASDLHNIKVTPSGGTTQSLSLRNNGYLYVNKTNGDFQTVGQGLIENIQVTLGEGLDFSVMDSMAPGGGTDGKIVTITNTSKGGDTYSATEPTDGSPYWLQPID